MHINEALDKQLIFYKSILPFLHNESIGHVQFASQAECSHIDMLV